MWVGSTVLRSLHRTNIARVGLIILFGAVIGAYPTIVLGTADYRLSVALLAIPVTLGLLVLKDAPRILFILLALSLSLSARFRPLTGGEFHPGGAELSIAPLDFPFLALLFLWIADFTSQARKPRPILTYVDLSVVLFLGAHVLSLLSASDRGLAILEILRLVKMGLLLLLIRHYVRTRQGVKLTVGVLLIAVILQGTLAVIQSVLGTSLGLGFLGEREEFWQISRVGLVFGRAGGTMGHANALANFFEVLTPLALALLLRRVGGALSVLAAAAAGAGVVGVFLTFSRAGWAAMLIGIVVTILTVGGLRIARTRHMMTVISVVLVLLCLLFIGAKDLIVGRLLYFQGTSWNMRLVMAQTAWRTLSANPLVGVGANNYLSVSSTYADIFPEARWTQISAGLVHNVFLLAAAELGLFGITSFLLLIGVTVWQAIQIVKCHDPLLSPVAAGLMAGIIALLAHGMWDWLFRYDPVYTLFWFSVGLLLAIGNIIVRETDDSERF